VPSDKLEESIDLTNGVEHRPLRKGRTPTGSHELDRKFAQIHQVIGSSRVGYGFKGTWMRIGFRLLFGSSLIAAQLLLEYGPQEAICPMISNVIVNI
jgi:hypothetical protein